jgi:hypothetical protein
MHTVWEKTIKTGVFVSLILFKFNPKLIVLQCATWALHVLLARPAAWGVGHYNIMLLQCLLIAAYTSNIINE